jgi:hypothetical protein
MFATSFNPNKSRDNGQLREAVDRASMALMMPVNKSSKAGSDGNVLARDREAGAYASTTRQVVD